MPEEAKSTFSPKPRPLDNFITRSALFRMGQIEALRAEKTVSDNLLHDKHDQARGRYWGMAEKSLPTNLFTFQQTLDESVKSGMLSSEQANAILSPWRPDDLPDEKTKREWSDARKQIEQAIEEKMKTFDQF